MTKKDFFRLLIKVFGLYSVITIVFSAFPSNVFMALNNVSMNGIVLITGSLTGVCLLFVFLLYKPDAIIRVFKLEKGFDDDRIDFQNFNYSNLLKLATIVIGGLLFIENIPPFLSHTFFAFTASAGNEFNDARMIQYGDAKDYIRWATSFLNLIIGYLMLTNYNFIGRMLKEKESKE